MKNCSRCAFYHRINMEIGKPQECRYDPPKLFLVPNDRGGMSQASFFPLVPANAWCGQFEPKSAEDTIADVVPINSKENAS